MINCYQYTAQGWKFFTKAKEWKSDPAIFVTSEFSSLTKVSPLPIKSMSDGSGGGSNTDHLELEEADIMHVGKAVEGEARREGLYIRWAFTLAALH